jgi:hypothetical protein
MTARSFCLILVFCLLGVALMSLAEEQQQPGEEPGKTPPGGSDQPATTEPEKKTDEAPALPPPPAPEKPRSYAVVMSGTSGSEQHAKWYKGSTGMLFRTLTTAYGYPADAVYYLYESPEQVPETDGIATFVNFKRIMAHLTKIMRSQDRLLVYMIGHGGFVDEHSTYNFVGQDMKDTDLAKLLDALPTVNVVVVMSPCQMGKFVDRCSKKGRVIVSSTRYDEGNRAGFAEYFIMALEQHLNDKNGDGQTSMKEAYDQTVREVKRWYENAKIEEIEEHAMLDDNGDGAGHYGEGVVEGDGEFADTVFIGNEGKKFEPDAEFESWLKECNKSLKFE